MEIQQDSIESLEPNETHVGKEGYLVKLSSGKAALHDSATAEAFGVITDGEATDGRSSVAVLGGKVGAVRVKLTLSAVTKGQRGKQVSDGTVTLDNGSGARVVVCKFAEDGAIGELVRAYLFTPIVYAS
jgi:hypothetical protein